MLKKQIKSNKGQGLVEYLIIVAIVAVGSIAVIKAVGGNINVQFANVVQALDGKSHKKIDSYEATKSMYEKKDFSNFFEGAVNSKDDKKK